MDANDSTVYVTKLLQQLEELKRKKARKLERLKKLKKPSSCKQDNHNTEDISQHTSAIKEKQDGSEAKCTKCELGLISKDAPCIQCLSAESSENRYQLNSENTVATLRAELANSENELNSNSKLDRNNDFKQVRENLSKQNQTLKITHDNVVLVSSPDSTTVSTFNEMLTNDRHRVARKQRKRSTTLEDKLEQDDHKKLKLSREIFEEKNEPNNSCSVTENHSNEEGAISAVLINVENKLKEKAVADPVIRDAVEDSLLHNMSCFLSTGLLVEEEKNAGTHKQSNLDGLETKNNIDLKCSANDVNISSCPTKVKNSNNSEVDSLVKTDHCSAQADHSTLDKPAPKLERLFENGDCVHTMNTSLPFNVGSEKVLDTFSDAATPQCQLNSENAHAKDFIHCEQMHNSTLCSDKGTNGDTEIEVSAPQLEKKNDFREDTVNCLSDLQEVKSEKCEAKASENSPSNSQLIKDLKVTDFSSFENSDSPENARLVAEAERAEDDHTPSLLDSSDRMNSRNMSGDIMKEEPYCENSHAPENAMDNETPDLIHNVNFECKNIPEYKEEHSLNCVPETSGLNCDLSLLEIGETENLFVDDALTADIDFECTSLEVADTMEDLLTMSSKNGLAVSPDKPLGTLAKHTSINVMEVGEEVFTVPETELLDASHFSKTGINFHKCKDLENQNRVVEGGVIPSETEDLDKVSSVAACDVFDETQCDTLDQLQTIQDSIFLDAEDSLELGNYKNIPFAENEVKKTSSSDLEELQDAQQTIMKHVCCLQGDIDEAVNDIQLVFFNNSSYVFIQHITWIQVWRQEENKDWTKIFTHQVDTELTLKEICYTKNSSHLVLVMLLCSDQVHCLQFLLFESEARVIKLMEHTHWLQNRCPNETVLLCGLGDLKFATAQGKDTFDVFLHIFSSLQDNPRLMMATLGSTTGILHSLCNIEKLPNALMGTSNNMLYVWHLLEARLVTSVCVQLPDPLFLMNRCIWATIENGLVFFMAVCERKETSQSSHLLATNLATGFCQIAMTYSFLPSTEKPRTRNLKTVYCEPFLAASCEDGAFLWSVTDEYCCAALEAKDKVTSVSIGSNGGDAFLIAVGSDTGCVNCFGVKCSS